MEARDGRGGAAFEAGPCPVTDGCVTQPSEHDARERLGEARALAQDGTTDTWAGWPPPASTWRPSWEGATPPRRRHSTARRFPSGSPSTRAIRASFWGT